MPKGADKPDAAEPNERLPCDCACGCVPRGCNRHETARWCWPCSNGIHHRKGFRE